MDSPSSRRALRGAMPVTVRPLHASDKDERAYWRGLSGEEKMGLVWEMALEYQAWRHGDRDQPRLQRSRCRVERRRR